VLHRRRHLLHRGHRFDCGHARAAARAPRSGGDAPARRAASRMEVRAALDSDPLRAAAGRHRQHGGHAVHGADAGDCGAGAARRAEHARPADDRDRCRRARGRALSRAARIGAGPWPHHHVGVHRVRHRARDLFADDLALVRVPHAGDCRLRLHDSSRRHQYGPADDRRGAAARPGDVVLHDGLLRHRADRQPAWRHPGGSIRRHAHGDGDGHRLSRRQRVVRVQAARHPRRHPANLPRARHYYRSSCGYPKSQVPNPK